MRVKLNSTAMAALVLVASVASAQDITVRIGFVGPLSGWLEEVGTATENGARLAIDELNAKGVVIGGSKASFVLVSADDGADPNRGAAVARGLVDGKVNGVVGHFTSGSSMSGSKTYSDAGIPQISPAATNPKFTRDGFKTAFRVVADDTQLAGALGRYAVKELKATSVAVIDDGTAYGQGIADEFTKAVRAAGGNVVESASVSQQSTDFAGVLTAIKSRKPDVVFFGGLSKQAGAMIKQMRQLAVDARIMGGDGVCTTDLPKWAEGAMTDGQVICAEAGGVGAGAPAMTKFRTDYRQKFGPINQHRSPYAYDALMVMVDAMVRAGSSNPAQYLPALAATSGYQGVTGPISFDEKGDLKNGALTLFTYKGNNREAIAVVR